MELTTLANGERLEGTMRGGVERLFGREMRETVRDMREGELGECEK